MDLRVGTRLYDAVNDLSMEIVERDGDRVRVEDANGTAWWETVGALQYKILSGDHRVADEGGAHTELTQRADPMANGHDLDPGTGEGTCSETGKSFEAETWAELDRDCPHCGDRLVAVPIDTEDNTTTEATPLSTLAIDREAMQAIATSNKEWVPYDGPQGGEGWRNTETGEVVYDDEPPGEVVDDVAAARELTQAVGDTLGENPGREEFEAAEGIVTENTALSEADFSSFDAAQAERAAAELGRMDARGDLDGLESFSSSIPNNVRETQGNLPMHYDRDGKGVSVTPEALSPQTAEQLHEQGLIASPDAEHLMRHAVGHHAHAEALESGATDADADPTEATEDVAAEADVDEDDGESLARRIAAGTGQLALATGAELVAEVYAMARGGRAVEARAVNALYRKLGGPRLEDLT